MPNQRAEVSFYHLIRWHVYSHALQNCATESKEKTTGRALSCLNESLDSGTLHGMAQLQNLSTLLAWCMLRERCVEAVTRRAEMKFGGNEAHPSGLLRLRERPSLTWLVPSTQLCVTRA